MPVETLSDQPSSCRNFLSIELYFFFSSFQKTLTNQFKFCPNPMIVEYKECATLKFIYGVPAQVEETFQQSRNQTNLQRHL